MQFNKLRLLLLLWLLVSGQVTERVSGRYKNLLQ